MLTNACNGLHAPIQDARKYDVSDVESNNKDRPGYITVQTFISDIHCLEHWRKAGNSMHDMSYGKDQSPRSGFLYLPTFELDTSATQFLPKTTRFG